MKKIILMFFFVIFCLGLCSCTSESEEISENKITETVTEQTTILNKRPSNEYPDEYKTITVPEFNPDLNKPGEEELAKDGSKMVIYDSENKEFHDSAYFDSDGNLTGYRKSVYNSNGTLKNIFSYDNDKNYVFAVAREYDSLGRYYRYYYYNSKSELVCYEEVQYDGNGTDVGVLNFDSAGNQLEELPTNWF